MKRYCTCDGWQKGMKQIVDQAVFCANQSAAPKYDGPKFKYCPWCGGKLFILKEK